MQVTIPVDIDFDRNAYLKITQDSIQSSLPSQSSFEPSIDISLQPVVASDLSTNLKTPAKLVYVAPDEEHIIPDSQEPVIDIIGGLQNQILRDSDSPEHHQSTWDLPIER